MVSASTAPFWPASAFMARRYSGVWQATSAPSVAVPDGGVGTGHGSSTKEVPEEEEPVRNVDAAAGGGIAPAELGRRPVELPHRHGGELLEASGRDQIHLAGEVALPIAVEDREL